MLPQEEKQMGMNRGFYSEAEKKLWEMYKEKGVGDCETCMGCRGEERNGHLSRPVSAWFVGDRFYENDHLRILFVGKNARGFFPDAEKEEDRGVSAGINNAFGCRLNLTGKGWAFWNYTREIIGECFGDDSPEHVALTNMVKCNNSDSIDTTTEMMKASCIRNLRILTEEIRIVNPTHIVFYTGWDYDDYIKDVFDPDSVRWDCSQRQKVGKYDSPWGAGIGSVDGRKIQFLRTCHPERKNKTKFVELVYDWIKKTES